MATVTTWIDCYLNQPVKVQYLQGNLFTADNNAHKVGVKVYSSADTPASLSGTVSADIVRSDGVTVTASGTLSGNQCSVTVPTEAYATPGTVIIAIKLTSNSVVTTLGVFACEIYDTSSGSIIDPGTIIPSIESLIISIDRAVSSIPVDYSSLWTTFAPAFSTNMPYRIGQYVTYNGTVYRFIVNRSAGAWSSSDVIQIDNVGRELTDLKNAIDNIDGVEVIHFKSGYIKNNGSTVDLSTIVPSPSGYSFVHAVVDCSEGDVFTITGYGGSNARLWSFIDSSGNVLLPEAAANVRMTLGKITAPENAVKLIIDSNITGDPFAIKGKTIQEQIPLFLRSGSTTMIINDDQAASLINSDANSVEVNTIYGIGQRGLSIVNLPGGSSYVTGNLITLGFRTGALNGKSQLYLVYTYNKIFMRSYQVGVWSDWTEIASKTDVDNLQTSITNINNALSAAGIL